MEDKLKEFLSLSNDSLLSSFKWGSEGAGKFSHFMRMIRQEINSKEIDYNKDKKVIDYDIPCQGQDQIDEYNTMARDLYGEKFTPLKSTDEHIDIFLDKIIDSIQEVGDEGGWYLGDGIKVKVELEYDMENK